MKRTGYVILYVGCAFAGLELLAMSILSGFLGVLGLCFWCFGLTSMTLLPPALALATALLTLVSGMYLWRLSDTFEQKANDALSPPAKLRATRTDSGWGGRLSDKQRPFDWSQLTAATDKPVPQNAKPFDWSKLIKKRRRAWPPPDFSNN